MCTVGMHESSTSCKYQGYEPDGHVQDEKSIISTACTYACSLVVNSSPSLMWTQLFQRCQMFMLISSSAKRVPVNSVP